MTQTSLRNDLDSIHKYGQEWKITFNSSKTVQQTFSFKNDPDIPRLVFNDQVISVNDSHKHLGISLSISKDLKFKVHINDIIKKVNKAMGPIYPIAKYLPRTALHQIYLTYIDDHTLTIATRFTMDSLLRLTPYDWKNFKIVLLD